MNELLRIGIILPNSRLPRWMAEGLADIRQGDYAEVAVVVVLETPHGTVGRTAMPRRQGLSMSRIDMLQVTALEGDMGGDESPGFENADLIGQDMDVEDTSAGRVGHAVLIATDPDHAVVRDTAFELQDRLVGCMRQPVQGRLFFGECLVN